jgi:hypothetical protein
MDDKQILHQINELVGEEHDLRGKVQHGQLGNADEQARLRVVEEALDQCWDLLRQRRAARESGTNPDEAHARPTGEVEGYLQ